MAASGYEIEALNYINLIDFNLSKLEEANKFADKKEKKKFINELTKSMFELESKFQCLMFVDKLDKCEEDEQTDQVIKEINQLSDTDKKILVKFMEYVVKTGEVLKAPDLSYRFSCYNLLKALL